VKLELADFPPELIETLAERVREQSGATETSPWMTIKEAAAHLKWPVSRLEKNTSPKFRESLPERDRVPLRRYQGRIMFDRDALDEWGRRLPSDPPLAREQ
jgi:hypothetical protein